MEPSVLLFVTSNTVIIFLSLVLLSMIVLLFELKSKTNKMNGKSIRSEFEKAPGPKPFPIIGNLACLDGYEVPYQAFDDLATKYGSIISLRLGSVPTVVVNGIENIKEVLISKTSHFDSRPNFRRYHDLFSGNKENSLAFCNWSNVQKKRRDMLVQHSFPRNFSVRFHQLNDVIINQMQVQLSEIRIESERGNLIPIKPFVLQSCANIFTQYFCSRNFPTTDVKFQKMIYNFDKIFFEVNQGYAADFLPFLLPFHTKNLKRMEMWSNEIRQFILETIIEDRKEIWRGSNEQTDYVETLIDHVTQNYEPKMEWETALFALEDIIGGHSAVGNFLVKVFGYVAQRPNVQRRIQSEIDVVLQRKSQPVIELSDRNQMPYTEAVIMEALRLIASPIVPHVANRDSTIGGYLVEKDTLIFLNNYNLSMSEELWQEPEEFMPERFLQDNRIVKPDHFLPYGAGRRSCMGYKMVNFVSFAILANVMQSFDLSPEDGKSGQYRVPAGSLAVPEKSYEFKFKPRV